MKKRHVVSKEYSAACYERIILARTKMIMECPFFGILAARLKLVENNTWCRTLAVDGKHLYYNVEFVMGIEDPSRRAEYEQLLIDSIDGITPKQIDEAINGLSDNNLIAGFIHEILHCAYNHFQRLGTRDRRKFNRAADYAINQIIKRDSKLGEIGQSWLYDPKYNGMAAEEIYNLLEDEEGAGGSGKGSGGGAGTGAGGTLDQHDIPQEGESAPEFTDEERAKFMEDFKDAMVNAAMAHGAPPEIRAMIDEYKNPTIDWRTMLNKTLRSLIKNDLSYMRPSRRSWSTGFGTTGSYYNSPIFPGLQPDNDIDICVALDASGSISTEMLRDFLSEVIGMTKQFTQFKIRILTFDTGVYTVMNYVTGEEQKILQYPVRGGGGTLFTAVWDHMKEDSYVPNQLVMFTDGEPWGSWGDPDYCETLFVIHSNPKKMSPFGTTIHYDANA